MSHLKLVDTLNNEYHEAKVFESDYYIVEDILEKEINFKNYVIKIKNDSHLSSYLPPIYLSKRNFGASDSDDYKLEVGTKSIGSLTGDKFEQFVVAQKIALEHVKEINDLIILQNQ